MTTPACPCYAGHRFPAEVISHAVWLYFRFPLSLLPPEPAPGGRAAGGARRSVSHQTVRQWGLKFGQAFANEIRRRLPRVGDKWHWDEVAVKIAGVQHWLWRAVDQGGTVLDILVQSRRNTKAAKRFFKKLLKGLQFARRVIVTDKLKSYGAPKREVLPDVEHRQSRYLNNPAENSHQPTRRRERQMQRFKSGRQAQRFLFAHSFIYGHFRSRRHRMAAGEYRALRANAFGVWRQGTCARKAA